MNVNTLLSKITVKSPEMGGQLKDIKKYSILDPEISVTKSRKLLELIINGIETDSAKNLAEKIQTLDSRLPSSIITYMHFIRKLGNSAIHEKEPVPTSVANDVLSVLISLVCWDLKIDTNDTENSQARFFIADPIYKTWSKIAVLTEDGVLYSEYLTYMKPTIFKKEQISFQKFQAEDFCFGELEHRSAYQPLREVSFSEAANYQLQSQDNWVKRYLDQKR